MPSLDPAVRQYVRKSINLVDIHYKLFNYKVFWLTIKIITLYQTHYFFHKVYNKNIDWLIMFFSRFIIIFYRRKTIFSINSVKVYNWDTKIYNCYYKPYFCLYKVYNHITKVYNHNNKVYNQDYKFWIFYCKVYDYICEVYACYCKLYKPIVTFL